MIKGLVITHGNLGREFISVVEKIVEDNVGIDFLCFDWKEDGTTMMKQFEKYINAHENDNIIIFTDMFGGSPTNICFKYKRKNIEIITGINLPGLLKFVSYRDKEMSFKQIANIVKKGAIDGINLISEYLGEKKS